MTKHKHIGRAAITALASPCFLLSALFSLPSSAAPEHLTPAYCRAMGVLAGATVAARNEGITREQLREVSIKNGEDMATDDLVTIAYYSKGKTPEEVQRAETGRCMRYIP